MEVFFVSYDVQEFQKHLKGWFTSFQKFFLKDIQSRILRDQKKLFSNVQL
jgi:hypothetical protein